MHQSFALASKRAKAAMAYLRQRATVNDMAMDYRIDKMLQESGILPHGVHYHFVREHERLHAYEELKHQDARKRGLDFWEHSVVPQPKERKHALR